MRRPPVFRFAPSPNGALHLGHARSALLNADMAEAVGGRLLLRMEDIDQPRCSQAFEDAIGTDLAWLGLRWEEPVRRQSEHFDVYGHALRRLIADGLVYPAFLSRGALRARVAAAHDRGENWPQDPDGAPLYPDDDRRRAASQARQMIADGLPFAWRLRMDDALAGITHELSWMELGGDLAGPGRLATFDARAWGDVVLARRDVPTSYHLAVTVDDAAQAVTHVVRGRDLYAATAVHRVLQGLLGLPAPLYHHHALVLGPDGRKLSKSHGATALAQLREDGATPADIRRLALEPAGASAQEQTLGQSKGEQ
jgi:glutamyl-Q tRNA(Asp) synthetase